MPHTVPSVNPTEQEIEDNETASEGWIDPLFTSEEGPQPLSDDPDNLTEVPDAEMSLNKDEESAEEAVARAAEKKRQKAEDESETEEAGVEGDAEPSLTAEDLDQVLSENDEQLDDDEEPQAEEAEAQPQRKRRNNRARRERRARERETSQQLQQLQAANAEQNAQIRVLTDLMKGGAQQQAVQAEAEPAPPPPPEERPIPKLADFDFVEDDYSAAMADWTKNQVAVQMHEREVASSAKAELQQQQQQTEQEAEQHQEHMREIMIKFRGREEEMRETHEDYDDVVYDKDVKIHPTSAQVAWDSEVGPELAYYLATHQDEVKSWPEKNERAIATNTMRIEARLLNEKQRAEAGEAIPKNDPDGVVEAEEAGAGKANAAEQAATTTTEAAPRRSTKRRTKTNAPPPPPRVKGAGASDEPDLNTMSMDEYRRARGYGPTP